MRNMVHFIAGTSAAGAGPGGLLSQIQELERTVPAAAKPIPGQNQPVENATSANVLPSNRKPESVGILALISDLVALSRKMHTIDESTQLTNSLAQASKDLRSPLGASLREMAKRGDQLANEPPAAQPATLAQQRSELDTLTTQFKLGSDVVLPLVKQRILLDLYKRNLANWRNAVKTQYTAQLKGLVVRLVVLALVLGAVIVASQLWSKALFRYVQDARRRYQLLLVRRIVLWCVVAVILAFAFATELGSLATFAGLLTAGVAVALQNVILSIAGYFFLIGKYGVRVGDRVQIAGVTGEVVDIGLVRLHLMEVGTGGTDAQPTGRVVVFSNSVVFQPTGGLFKQIPGTNFIWHEITLTMAPESNYRAVEERLMGAVETVFAQYREEIEGQRRHIERTLGPVSVKSLGPQSRLRLTQTGLEVVIRYPVELDTAAKIDDGITREVLDAIEREPKLKLVGSGIPNIQELRGETVGNGKA
jgi:small-conductance mechanosensitive channel